MLQLYGIKILTNCENIFTDKEEFNKTKQTGENIAWCNYRRNSFEQDEIQITYISIFTTSDYCEGDLKPTNYLITTTTKVSDFSMMAVVTRFN